eukprot:5771608-Pleurochrysis_carterae.AAC.1
MVKWWGGGVVECWDGQGGGVVALWDNGDCCGGQDGGVVIGKGGAVGGLARVEGADAHSLGGVMFAFGKLRLRRVPALRLG